MPLGFFQKMEGCMILGGQKLILITHATSHFLEKTHRNLVSDNGNIAYLYVTELCAPLKKEIGWKIYLVKA